MAGNQDHAVDKKLWYSDLILLRIRLERLGLARKLDATFSFPFLFALAALLSAFPSTRSLFALTLALAAFVALRAFAQRGLVRKEFYGISRAGQELEWLESRVSASRILKIKRKRLRTMF